MQKPESRITHHASIISVAVTVPEGVKAKMGAAQAELRRVLLQCSVRWARREQFHLTLRFLGDVQAARVEALGEAIRAACRGFGALHLRDAKGEIMRGQIAPRVAVKQATRSQALILICGEDRETAVAAVVRVQGFRSIAAQEIKHGLERGGV